MIRDLRHSARTLLRTPGFTLVVVATLALGIGANTAIFSVVNAVLLERLPYEEPDRLVAIWVDVSERGGPEKEWLNYPDLDALAEEQGLLEAAASWSTWRPTLLGRDPAVAPEVVEGAMLSHEMLVDVLRASPAVGRFFGAGDDVPGAAGVVVLTYASWQQRFGGDAGVLGSTLTLSDLPYTVVGVASPGFRLPFAPDAEIFRAMGVIGERGCGRGCFGTRGIARLAAGVPLGLAQQRAREIGTRLEAAYPDTNTGLTFTLTDLREDLTGGSARGLWVLLGAVGLVLLIACTNVANLLLVRASAREGELAVRSALGAGRGAIVRQLITESLLLAAVGGGAGLFLGSWGTDVLLSLAPASLPRIDDVGLDGRVLLFTAGVTLATGLVFGLLPSWRASRSAVFSSIRSHGGRHAGGRHLRNGLVVAEVATALVLLVGAGLLVRSFQRLAVVDLGFDQPEDVLTFRVAVPGSRYGPAARVAFFDALLDRVRAIPGVESAGAVNSLPLDGINTDTGFRLEGEPPPVRGVDQAIWLRPVMPGYFETMGLETLEGRSLSPSDDAQASPVALVNESFARQYFGGAVIGRRIAFSGDATDARWWTIVGVTRDVHHFAIRAGSAAGPDPTAVPDEPAAYLPYGQLYVEFAPAQMSVVARTEGDPLSLAPDIRRALSEVDPRLAASQIRPVAALVDDALARDRFVTALLSLFAATALLLAALGIYGVVSYGVNRRMREMGIRTALGAERADLGWMVVGGGLRLAGVGIVVGTVGALLATRALRGLLYDVEATDPTTFVATAAVLVGVATLASWVPTRRLRRADPVSVLRAE
ncbi:MAG: ABC transporter permease [Gemmatimonadales bacterium]